MDSGLIISVVDPDEEYLGIEILASSGRYSGATRVYVGLQELSAFASQIEGFPATSRDDRRYEFGSRRSDIAGGVVSLRFHCVDGPGHALLEVSVDDDSEFYAPATAQFTIKIHAADLDRFVGRLRAVEKQKTGQAILHAAA